MSTFLQLAQNTRQSCRVAGTGPTAVTGQTGVLGRIVEWVEQSYTDIQNRHMNWRWMRRTATVNTTADDDTYAPGDWTDSTDAAVISRFGRWLINDMEDPCKCYLQSTGAGGEYWLSYTEWEHLKGIYKIGSQTSSNPAHVTIDPNNNVVMGPAPSAVYVLTADYQLSPQILAADGDTPEMPSQFHDLIVYEAMKNYGETEGASNIYISGNRRANRMMRALEHNQLPRMRLGPPLA